MRIFENIVNHKISTITADELLKYAAQFQISISPSQAEKIAQYLRSTKANIFDAKERAAIIKEIAKIAGPETAKNVNKLFQQFSSQSG